MCRAAYGVVIDDSCQVLGSRFYCSTYGVVKLVVSFLLGSLFQNHSFFTLMIKKVENVNVGGRRIIKHAKFRAKNAFNV